ncbi:hypothetical protein B296_00027817 [Ensete ventricosum]|uniref:Uncharacterized protein n=1 Tax=Ensete ventricosum TaxID=4639 RepID=A0A426YCP8_ENSVE|nr:hypothetical protein B296_00027817 [Ensete ventricosum]
MGGSRTNPTASYNCRRSCSCCYRHRHHSANADSAKRTIPPQALNASKQSSYMLSMVEAIALELVSGQSKIPTQRPRQGGVPNVASSTIKLLP